MEGVNQLTTYVLKRWFGRYAFCPVVDGQFIRDFPTLADRSKLGKPVLVGSNRNERNFLAFAYKLTNKTSEAFARALLERLPADQRETLLSGYPLPGKQALADLLADVKKIYKPAEISADEIQNYVSKLDIPEKFTNAELRVTVIVLAMLVCWSCAPPAASCSPSTRCPCSPLATATTPCPICPNPPPSFRRHCHGAVDSLYHRHTVLIPAGSVRKERFHERNLCGTPAAR